MTKPGRRSNVSMERPYGDLITTSVRVLTWNVWGRLGPWQAREAALVETLRNAQPDIVALQECWCDREGHNQADRLGQALDYHHAYGGGGFLAEDWGIGVALLSRWPIERHVYREFPSATRDIWGGAALFGQIGGPRGSIPVCSTILDWPPQASAVRQASVGHLASLIAEVAGGPLPPVVCGDFNASPDSDEIRMLTGRSQTALPGFVLYDAWEMAGNGGPGHTLTRDNPWAAPLLQPDRRIDYVCVGPPRKGGAGHIIRCAVAGNQPVNGIVPSDHYAVVADLRY